MYRRKFIVFQALKAFSEGAKEVLVPSKDEEKDHSLLYKMFHRRGEDIGISKDPFGEGLWLKKRDGD